MPAFSIYTVQKGDTLDSIAARRGVTWQVLARLNGLADPDAIYPGQRLRVPREEGQTPPRGTVYTVQPGDTLGSIAARFGTTVPVLLRLNSLQNSELIYPGQELRVPAAPAGDGWYEVQPGDTLYSLALRFGTTVEELARLNGVGTPNLIFPGERLRIPR